MSPFSSFMRDLEAGLSVARKKEMACEQTHVPVSEMNITVPNALVEARTELLELMLCTAPKGPSQEPVSRLRATSVERFQNNTV